MTYDIAITNDLNSLLADRAAWDALTDGVPMRQSAWIGPWWKTIGRNHDAHVLVARDGMGQLCGVLPLYVRQDSQDGGASMGKRLLSYPGDGQACTDYASVLAPSDIAADVARDMGRVLAETATDSQLGWNLVDIDGIIEGDHVMTAFAQGMQECGSVLHAHSRMSTWLRPRETSWEAHLKTHSKTQRRRMRRMSEKTDPGGEFCVVTAESESDVDRILDALIDMHQRRWTSEGQQGCYADDLFRSFIRTTCVEFLTQDKLCLVGLENQGKLIAAELNFIGDNRILYSYSAGYDIDHADLEPGRVLAINTLLRMYRQDLAGIDYMRGDESWKQRFSTQSRRVIRLRAAAPTWIPRMQQAVWCTGFELKQWLRKKTGRPLVDVVDLASPATTTPPITTLA